MVAEPIYLVLSVSEEDEAQIDLARQCGVMPKVVEFLKDGDSLVAPALRVR